VNDSWSAAYDVLQRKADARVQEVLEFVQRFALYNTATEALTQALQARKAVFNVKE
jgi:predicted transcriptional regulator